MFFYSPFIVVRRLNELYKASVTACRSLSTRLERFFSRKHSLMDQITSITAERLLFSHTVQMVSQRNKVIKQKSVFYTKGDRQLKECICRKTSGFFLSG